MTLIKCNITLIYYIFNLFIYWNGAASPGFNPVLWFGIGGTAATAGGTPPGPAGIAGVPGIVPLPGGRLSLAIGEYTASISLAESEASDESSISDDDTESLSSNLVSNGS